MCFSNQCKEKDIFQLPLCHKFLSPRKTHYMLSSKTRRFRWLWVNCCRSLIFETGPYRPQGSGKRCLTQPVQTLFSPGYTEQFVGSVDRLIYLRNLQEHRGPRCSQKRVTNALGIKRLSLSKPQTRRHNPHVRGLPCFFHQPKKKSHSNCDLLHRVVIPPISWDNGIDQFPASGTQLRPM